MDEIVADTLVVAALMPLGLSLSKGICQDEPEPDQFLVYDSDGDTPENYAGDYDEGYSFNRRVHYYRRNWMDPGNIQKLIRQRLRQFGFTISGPPIEVYDKNDYTHIVIFAYILGNIQE